MTMILYVEDDADNAFMLVQRLHRHGMAVRHVEDGEQALLAVARDRPDAILLDVNLPGADGLTVLRRLRDDAATRDLPVVIVSASVQDAALSKAMQAGADAFVAKPIDFDRLLQTLARLLADKPGAGGDC